MQFWKNYEKHRNNKLATTERRKNYLVSEPNYQTTQFFAENLLAVEMKKTQIHKYLSIQDIQYQN